MSKRAFLAGVIVAAAVSAFACGGGDTTSNKPASTATTAAPAAAPTSAGPLSLKVVFGGGYVFNFSADGKSAEVGAIDMAHSAATHKHSMILKIDTGAEDANPANTDLPSSQVAGIKGWDLENYEVRIRPGGADLGSGPWTSIPQTTPPAKACDTTLPVNNWNHVPNIPTLGNAVAARDISDRMMTRVPIRDGGLEVTELAPGCFSFKNALGTVKESLTAHGRNGVTYSKSANVAFVDLALYDVHDATKLKHRIRILPTAGSITLSINTRSSTTIRPGTPMTFFDMYYDLAVDKADPTKAVPPIRRLIPQWRAMGVAAVTPGGECPPVSFGAPQ